HLTAPPPRLADSRPDLAGLDAALGRAMAKNPADRFHTCVDFASGLSGKGIQPVRTVSAPLPPTLHAPVSPHPKPVEPVPHGSRTRRSGPLILLVGALVALLAAALIAVGILLFRNGNQQNLTQPQATPTSS